jgi:hypothetical protein
MFQLLIRYVVICMAPHLFSKQKIFDSFLISNIMFTSNLLSQSGYFSAK